MLMSEEEEEAELRIVEGVATREGYDWRLRS
jgi:hypothetical protein